MAPPAGGWDALQNEGPDPLEDVLRWLVMYTSAKEIVSGVLRVNGKLALLHEVFDDLAEVHRVEGVSDEAGEPAAPKPA